MSNHALRTTVAVAVIESASVLYGSVVVHMEPINAHHKCSVFNSMVSNEMIVLHATVITDTLYMYLMPSCTSSINSSQCCTCTIDAGC